MEIYPVLQGKLLLWCAALGVTAFLFCSLADALCDMLCKLRALKSILRFALDLALVLFSGAQILLLCYYFNKGSIRLFAFLGFFSSFALFRATLGSTVKALFYKTLVILHKILQLILSPFVKAIKILVNFLQKIIYFIAKAIAKFGVLVYNICIYKYMLKCSTKGFLKKRRKNV